MTEENFFSCDGILWFMSSWGEAATHGTPRSCLAIGWLFGKLTFWLFSRNKQNVFYMAATHVIIY